MFMLTVCLAKCIISEVYKKLLEISLLYNYTVRRYIRGYLISSSFLLKKFKKMKIRMTWVHFYEAYIYGVFTSYQMMVKISVTQVTYVFTQVWEGSNLNP